MIINVNIMSILNFTSIAIFSNSPNIVWERASAVQLRLFYNNSQRQCCEHPHQPTNHIPLLKPTLWTTQVHLTTVSTVLDRCAYLVCPRCPVGQSVLAQVEEGHGFEIQLPIWVRFGGHWHAVQEAWQNRVAGSGGTWWRDYLGSSLPWAMAARRHDGGGSVVIDICAGLRVSRQIFCWPVRRQIQEESHLEGYINQSLTSSFLFANCITCQVSLGLY